MHGARLIALAALTGLAGLAACGNADKEIDPQRQYGPNPVLPAPRQYLFPPFNVTSIVGWKNGAMPTVAPGLRIEAIATGLKHPRNVYTLPNRDILIVEGDGPGLDPYSRPKTGIQMLLEHKVKPGGAKPINRITLVRLDAAGRPILRTVFLDHLYSPFGVVLVGSDLYVANTNAVLRYDYTPGMTHIDAPGQVLAPLPGGPIDHHWTKSLTASPDGSSDGSKLYAGVGSNSNITENGIIAEKDRADILEIDRATGAWRHYASGLRNPNGLTFYPGTNTLWAVVNERDELGPDLVPDYLTSIKPGAFYGWPWSYWGQHVDVRARPPRPDMVARAIMPDYSLSSHVAPLGLAFYAGGGSLPARFTGGAFVGEHGSWDRGVLNGYKVVFIPFAGGRPAGGPEDIVSGFTASATSAHGRPVGVTFDRTGALLVADDAGNTIWRVTGGGNAQRASATVASR